MEFQALIAWVKSLGIKSKYIQGDYTFSDHKKRSNPFWNGYLVSRILEHYFNHQKEV